MRVGDGVLTCLRLAGSEALVTTRWVVLAAGALWLGLVCSASSIAQTTGSIHFVRQLPDGLPLQVEWSTAIYANDHAAAARARARIEALISTSASAIDRAVLQNELAAGDVIQLIEQGREEEALVEARRRFQWAEEQSGKARARESALGLALLRATFERGMHEEAVRLASELADALSVAWGNNDFYVAEVNYWAGLAHMAIGSFHASAVALDRAAAAYNASLGPSHPLTLLSAVQRAFLPLLAGDPPLADRALSELLDGALGEDQASMRTRSLALSFRAQTRAQMGDFVGALLDSQRAWAFARTHLGPDAPETLVREGSLASALVRNGRFEEALRLEQRLLPIYRKVYGDDSAPHLYSLYRIGSVLRRLGRHAEAARWLQECYERNLAVYGANHIETLDALAVLADVRLLLDQPDIAASLIERAQATAVALGSNSRTAPPELLQVQAAEARFLLSRDPSDRRELLETARSAIESPKISEQVRLRVLTRTAELLAGERETKAAAGLYAQLVQRVEQQMRRADWDPASRRGFFGQYARHYASYAALLVQTGDCEQAAKIAEAARTRQLRDGMARRRALDLALLPAAERNEIARLAAEIERLDAAVLTQPPGSSARLLADQEVAAATRRLRELEQRVGAQYPRYARMRAGAAVSVEEGRRALFGDEIFIRFLVDSNRVVATLEASSLATRCVDLGDIRAVAAASTALQAGLDDFGTSARDIESLVATLSDRLIRPLLPLIGSYRRWTINPDGPLTLVPFEALVADGARAVTAHEIGYAPSLTVLAALRQHKNVKHGVAWSRELLSFSAPAYRAGDDLMNVEAKLQIGGSERADPGRTRATPTLGPLAFAVQEAQQVAVLFPRSDIYVGQEASKAQLNRISTSGQIGKYRYLHFAAHGLLNTETPPLSAIALASTGDDNGMLYAFEIAGLDLQTEFAVLSACNTVGGGEVQGEGVMGLPYALFVAGNRNSLLTLSKVADRSAARFVVEVFKRVKAGSSPRQAVDAVKREMARSTDPRQRDIRSWAPFVLYGV